MVHKSGIGYFIFKLLDINYPAPEKKRGFLILRVQCLYLEAGC